MPDLGAYAGAVLGSYGAALLFLGALVGATLWRGAQVRARLGEVERRQGRRDG